MKISAQTAKLPAIILMMLIGLFSYAKQAKHTQKADSSTIIEVLELVGSDTLCPQQLFKIRIGTNLVPGRGTSYRVWLSDTSGNFVRRTLLTIIGSAQALNGELTCRLGASVLPGRNYRLRVDCVFPVVTGNISSFKVTIWPSVPNPVFNVSYISPCPSSGAIFSVQTNIPSSNIIYSWNVNGSNNFLGYGNPLITNQVHPNDSVTVTAQVLDGCQRGTNFRSKWVVFRPNPVQGFTFTSSRPGQSNFCLGDSVVFFMPRPIQGLKFKWSNGDTINRWVVRSNNVVRLITIYPNGCQLNSSDSLLVRFSPKPPKPVITRFPQGRLCKGDSVILFVSNAGNSLAIWDDGKIGIYRTVKSSGDYSVRLSNGGCFSDTAAEINLRFLKELPSLEGLGFYCGGPVQKYMLTDSTTHNPVLNWKIIPSAAGIFTRSDSNGVSVQWSSTWRGKAKLVAKLRPNSYCSNSDSLVKDIYLNDTSNYKVKIILPDTICPSSIFRLNTNFNIGNFTARQFKWYLNGVERTGNDSLAFFNYLQGGEKLKIEILGLGSCRTQIISDSVVIGLVNLNSASVIIHQYGGCNGSPIVFTAITSNFPGRTSLLWYLNGRLVATGNQYHASGLNNGDSVYAKGFSNISCISNIPVISNGILFQNSNYQPLLNQNGSRILTFCGPDSVRISVVNLNPAYRYTWSNGDTTLSILVKNSGSWSVKAENYTGCQIWSDTIKTLFNIPPAKPIIRVLNPGQHCVGDTVHLAIIGSKGYIPEWSNGSWDSLVHITQSGIFWVKLNNNGCFSQTDSISLNFIPKPQKPLFMNSIPNRICLGQIIQIKLANPVAGLRYTWFLNGDTIKGQNGVRITAFKAGSYQVVASNGLCKSGSDPFPLSINNPADSLTLTGSDTAICAGEQALLQIVGPRNPYGFIWTMDSIPISGLSQSNTIHANLQGTYRVVAFGAGNTCFAYSNPFYLKVREPITKPEIFLTDSIGNCRTQDITLTASSGYSNYRWSNGNTQQTNIVPANELVTVTVTDSNGCESSSAPFGYFKADKQDICMATVDSARNKHIILWSKPSLKGSIDSFIVYRKDAGIFRKIGKKAFADDSYFYDNSSNPNQGPQIYALGYQDSCGRPSEPGRPHKTLHVNISHAVGGGFSLTWSPYEGYNFNTYYILRGSSVRNLRLIDSIPAQLKTWTDPYPPQGDSLYLLVIRKTDICLAGTAKNANTLRFKEIRSNLIPQSAAGPDTITANRPMKMPYLGYNLFPNPGNGKIEIAINGNNWNIGTDIVQVYNSIGQMAGSFEINADSRSININHLSAGIYIIKLMKTGQVLRYVKQDE